MIDSIVQPLLFAMQLGNDRLQYFVNFGVPVPVSKYLKYRFRLAKTGVNRVFGFGFQMCIFKASFTYYVITEGKGVVFLYSMPKIDYGGGGGQESDKFVICERLL